MIPLFRPIFPSFEEIWGNYAPSLNSGILTNFGPAHAAMTKMLSDRFGGHWLGVSNGTVAIQLALLSLPKKIKKIAVPDFTFAATIQAVKQAGRTPIIFGCDPETGFIDVDLLKKNEKEFDAVLPVLPFGHHQPRALELRYFERKGVPVIFDAAGAFPASFKFAHACCYSLHAAKAMPAGEGGLIRFESREKRELAKRISCFDFDENKISQSLSGMNGKLDELRCSVVLAQLQSGRWLRRKIKMARMESMYREALSSFVEPRTIRIKDNHSMIMVRLKESGTAARLVSSGESAGVVFRRYYFPPLSAQGLSRAVRKIGTDPMAHRDWVALPADVSDSEFERVVETVRNALNKMAPRGGN